MVEVWVVLLDNEREIMKWGRRGSRKWGLLFCELEDDRSVRMEKAGF